MDGKQRKVRMKKLISFKQKYNPNDVVFAISFSKEDPDNDDFDANYAKIYKVRVLSVNIDEDGITYWLITVGDKNEWGDCVPEMHVSINKQDLVNLLLKTWKL